MSSDAIVLSRDCEATQVPYGDVKVLPAGTRVRVMQSLGDSFTVTTEQGEMMRVDGKNADALGRAIPQRRRGCACRIQRKAGLGPAEDGLRSGNPGERG